MKKYIIIIIGALLLNTFSLVFAQEIDRPLPPGKRRINNEQRIPLRDRPLTPKLEKKILKIIAEQEPLEVKHLTKLKRINPEEYREILLHAWKEHQFLKRLKKEDPDKYQQVKQRQELERMSRKLAREYRQSDDEQHKKTIKSELRDIIDELFDLREAEKEEEIFRLEKELNKMKKIVKKRQANKKEILNKHLHKLLGIDEYLDW